MARESHRLDIVMSVSPYLPAIVVVLTNVGTGVFVWKHQPDYPPPFALFQLAMLGFCLPLATRYRWLRISAFLLLIGGALFTGFSVGTFYWPTVAVAAGHSPDGHLVKIPSGSISHPVVGTVFKTAERPSKPLIGSTPICSRQPTSLPKREVMLALPETKKWPGSTLNWTRA